MAMTFQQQLEEALKRQQPAFRPSYEGLLSQPTSKVTTPETFQPGLLNQPSVGRQLGLLGLSFAPGAGISDYSGTFPSAQGGFEPSFQQNVQQGNYFTAGLQGLGAFGDMATAATAAMGPLALAGMGVGSIAKAPRAVQRGVEGLIDTVRPKIDDLGFFSQVEKSVMDIPQQKGTGQQFLAQIQKTPGVKPEELQYTGLDTFLANKPTVTKGEIQDYLDANRVQVQEVTLGSPQALEARDSQIAQRYGYQAEFDDGRISFYDTNLDDYVEFRDLPAAMRTELSNPQTEFGGATKFSQYTIPGGENYREVLLTLPAKQRPNQFTLRNNESGGTVGSFDTMEEAQEFMRTTPREDIRGGNWSVQETTSGTEPVYRSSHFDQPNILAHMRVNDRTIDGKPTLFIEEVQSDWHQAGRKQGYGKLTPNEAEELKNLLAKETPQRGLEGAELARAIELEQKLGKGVPDAPFKTSWDELTLKRAIKMASDEGYDQIAFTTGKTQAERYPGDERRSAGMETFYDKMIPKKLEKIGKKYGAKPTKSTMQTPDGEVEVWTFNIPKEMRETVKEQGQPLFQIGVGAAGLGTAGLLATEEEQY